MAASRMGAQYRAFVALRQFRQAAEDVSYLGDDGNPVALKAVVGREPNPENDRREGDGIYEVQRATLCILAVVDAVFGGIVLDTSDKIRDFKGKNFTLPVDEGGTPVADWIVKTVSPGACGHWEIGVVREKRVEVGKTRKNG